MGNTTGANTEARDIYPSETPGYTYCALDVQSVLCRPSFVCSSFYISQIIVCLHMIDFFSLLCMQSFADVNLLFKCR